MQLWHPDNESQGGVARRGRRSGRRVGLGALVIAGVLSAVTAATGAEATGVAPAVAGNPDVVDLKDHDDPPIAAQLTAADVTAANNAWGNALVGAASTPDGLGLLHVLANGRVNAYGQSQNFGGADALPLNGPMRGMAMTPSGNGYWLVAFDGGVFSYGDATFYGSMGGLPLNQPIFSLAPAPGGDGYWLVAFDGGIFAFGNAPFLGSMGGQVLNQPVQGITRSVSGVGYRMVARDGGIFSFGDAAFFGSLGGQGVNDVVDMALTPSGEGYWILTSSGRIFEFGDALPMPDINAAGIGHVAVAMVSNPVSQGLYVYSAPPSDPGSFRWWPFRSPPAGPVDAWNNLRAECAAGSMTSCDNLYRSSPFESEYELFAATCGNRLPARSARDGGRCVIDPPPGF